MAQYVEWWRCDQGIEGRAPSCSRKPLQLAEDILQLASRLAAAYG